jgi:phosphopantothenate-cysteine ligase
LGSKGFLHIIQGQLSPSPFSLFIVLVVHNLIIKIELCIQLETDSKILLEKATKALQKYKVHAVVANELLTRKEEVVVVSSSGNVVVRRDSNKPESIVEDNLIRLLVDRHSTYIKESLT